MAKYGVCNFVLDSRSTLSTTRVARLAEKTLLIVRLVVIHTGKMAEAATLAFEAALMLTATEHVCKAATSTNVARTMASIARLAKETLFVTSHVVWHRGIVAESAAFALEAGLLSTRRHQATPTSTDVTRTIASTTRLTKKTLFVVAFVMRHA